MSGVCEMYENVKRTFTLKIDFVADESYVLIDATNTDHVKTRKVTFANHRQDMEAESIYSNNDTDIAEIEKQYSVRGIQRGRPFSAPTYRSRPVVKKKPRVQSGTQRAAPKPKKAQPPKPKKFLAVKKSPRSRSASESSVKSPRNKKSESESSSGERSKNKSRSRSSSLSSRSRSRSRSKSNSSDYSSVSSRSSSSTRTRSRSPKVKLDHQLKDTNNVKIREWLKEKNKEYRKIQRQKRNEAKKKLKEKQEEEEKRQAKFEKSEVAVKQWTENKKREAQLIRKKNREERAKSNQSFETVSTQDTQQKSNKTKDNAADKNINDRNDNAKERVKTAKLRQPPTKPPQPKIRSRPKTAVANQKKEETKEEPPSKEEEEKKKRISYDEWVAQKRKQDQEDMKKAMKRKAEQLRKSDPEIDDVISKVGQNRISKIKEGKKRIDTGVKKIDDKANAGFKENLNDETQGAKGDKPKYQPVDSEKSKPKQQKKVVKKKVKGAKVPMPPQRAASPAFLAQPVPPATPKPEVPSERKQKVKHAERSWDYFSDYVWEKLNETDGDMQRPEPQGSDKPDPGPRDESAANSSTSGKQTQEPHKQDGDDAKLSDDEKKDFEKDHKPSEDKVDEANKVDETDQTNELQDLKKELDSDEEIKKSDDDGNSIASTSENDYDNRMKSTSEEDASGKESEKSQNSNNENETKESEGQSEPWSSDSEKETDRDKDKNKSQYLDRKTPEYQSKETKGNDPEADETGVNQEDVHDSNSDSDTTEQNEEDEQMQRRTVRPRTGKVRKRIDDDDEYLIKNQSKENLNDKSNESDIERKKNEILVPDREENERKEDSSENEPVGTFLTEPVE